MSKHIPLRVSYFGSQIRVRIGKRRIPISISRKSGTRISQSKLDRIIKSATSGKAIPLQDYVIYVCPDRRLGQGYDPAAPRTVSLVGRTIANSSHKVKVCS